MGIPASRAEGEGRGVIDGYSLAMYSAGRIAILVIVVALAALGIGLAIGWWL